jgi:Saxitoxin biosynthesis operon protein SxtJ
MKDRAALEAAVPKRECRSIAAHGPANGIGLPRTGSLLPNDPAAADCPLPWIPVTMSAIEDLKREEDVEIGSDRSFGIVFFVVFLIIGLWPLMKHGTVRWWALAIAAAFLVIALVVPKILAPLNRVWMKFGLLLAAIISPIFLGILFYLVFMPMGLLIRLFGKDPLKLQLDREARSYWVDRDPPGPPPGSITNQF